MKQNKNYVFHPSFACQDTVPRCLFYFHRSRKKHIKRGKKKKKTSKMFFNIKCYFLNIHMKILIPDCFFDPFHN